MLVLPDNEAPIDLPSHRGSYGQEVPLDIGRTAYFATSARNQPLSLASAAAWSRVVTLSFAKMAET